MRNEGGQFYRFDVITQCPNYQYGQCNEMSAAVTTDASETLVQTLGTEDLCV